MKKKPLPAIAARGEGSFFRRYKGKYYPASADVPGTVYYCLAADGERLRISCHTKNLLIARRYVQTHLNSLDLSSDQRFLESLAKAGEQAKARLEADITAPRKRR